MYNIFDIFTMTQLIKEKHKEMLEEAEKYRMIQLIRMQEKKESVFLKTLRFCLRFLPILTKKFYPRLCEKK